MRRVWRVRGVLDGCSVVRWSFSQKCPADEKACRHGYNSYMYMCPAGHCGQLHLDMATPSVHRDHRHDMHAWGLDGERPERLAQTFPSVLFLLKIQALHVPTSHPATLKRNLSERSRASLSRGCGNKGVFAALSSDPYAQDGPPARRARALLRLLPRTVCPPRSETPTLPAQPAHGAAAARALRG